MPNACEGTVAVPWADASYAWTYTNAPRTCHGIAAAAAALAARCSARVLGSLEETAGTGVTPAPEEEDADAATGASGAGAGRAAGTIGDGKASGPREGTPNQRSQGARLRRGKHSLTVSADGSSAGRLGGSLRRPNYHLPEVMTISVSPITVRLSTLGQPMRRLK